MVGIRHATAKTDGQTGYSSEWNANHVIDAGSIPAGSFAAGAIMNADINAAAAIAASKLGNLPASQITSGLAGNLGLTGQILNVVAATPGNPTAITSGTKMEGLGLAGCTITPVRSGTIIVIINYNLQATTSGQYAQAQGKYGTGTAPSNGATASGTNIGAQQTMWASGSFTAGNYTLLVALAGLTLNTAYWFDFAVTSGSGQVCQTISVSFLAFEL